MKRIFLILLCLTTYIASSHSQTEVGRDSISHIGDNKLPQNSNLEASKEEVGTIENSSVLDSEELKRRVEFVKNMPLRIPEFYIGPSKENKTLGEKLPHTNDYAFGNYTPLGNNFSVSTVSRQDTYFSIGASREVNVSLNYQPAHWLGMSGGMYGAKYNAYGQHYDDAGFNASWRIRLHDRIYLHGHGNYSMNSHDKNRYLGAAAMGMFPQTYYGGGIELKITDNFGVEGGMVREFNPMIRKWENKPYLMPVFYSNGRRK